MKLTEAALGNVGKHLIDIINLDVVNQNPEIPLFYLEGGHFDPRYSLTDFSKNSLSLAIGIANNIIIKHKKDIKVALGILIDDLGLQCGAEVCEISPLPSEMDTEQRLAGELPEGIESILAASRIVKRDRLFVQGERTCKNRGIQSLRKILMQHQVSPFSHLDIEADNQAEKIYFINEKNQRVLLAESKSKETWIAKCPVIMAQHYSDVYHKVIGQNPQVHSVHIIDFSETDDYNKVINGASVAAKLFLHQNDSAMKEVKITNIFLSPFDENDFLIHSTSNAMGVAAI
ncbi:hypothetical protein [Pantoea coffeiphila]|uniref:hypothetical protein n=1 Tax=Pantoea coffeiphila TaxID=1465635 RepID=UPI001960279E|nr:hypothetical protein [Pantoea coffeiphila]MBM7343013.1 hypothetical protein [Pantoea coffeiphila]